MELDVAAQLTALLVLGIGAQWLAWRLRLPAILLLLVVGGIAGPGMEWAGYEKIIDPEKLLGDLLIPIVSLSVAVVLFEGGLTLDIAELPHAGKVIGSLLTVGAGITFALGTVTAHWILDFSWPLASLLGAIVMVTGPTVIGPLLRHVKPIGRTGPILKWEGIVIDPAGAMLALLIFESMFRRRVEQATVDFVSGIIGILVVGAATGVVSGWVSAVALRRFLVPGYLQSPVTLAIVLATFSFSNYLSAESGLVAVTVMGIVLANLERASLGNVLEFKESLSVLLISQLFILLSSRLTVSQIQSVGWRPALYTLLLIVLVRPLAVWVSTFRSGLSRAERIFLASMAPRGIVAASVASLFALRLAYANYEGARQLVPVTFTVIVGTVTVYGLAAPWISRRMGLSTQNPGFLIAGGNPVARCIALALQEQGIDVLVADKNFDATRDARLLGIPVVFASVLSDYVESKLGLSNIGRLLALTSSEEVNTLATTKYAHVFGREQVFQLATDSEEPARKQKVAPVLQGRVLFGPGVTYSKLAGFVARGNVIKRTTFTEAFGWKDYLALHGEDVLPLFLIAKSGKVNPVVIDGPITVRSGDAVMSLVKPNESAPPGGD